jgi:hypothetical protein
MCRCALSLACPLRSRVRSTTAHLIFLSWRLSSKVFGAPNDGGLIEDTSFVRSLIMPAVSRISLRQSRTQATGQRLSSARRGFKRWISGIWLFPDPPGAREYSENRSTGAHPSIGGTKTQERDTGLSNQSALQGAALHTCCKSLPGCTEPTHNPEPHRDRDTEFARNEREGSRGRHREYSSDIAARQGQCGSAVGAWG